MSVKIRSLSVLAVACLAAPPVRSATDGAVSVGCCYVVEGVTSDSGTTTTSATTDDVPSTSELPTTSGSTGGSECNDDGHVDLGEQCDDGNPVETDACLPGCIPASCGDFLIWEGMEECDFGADNNSPGYICTDLCMFAKCGDGRVLAESFGEFKAEDCDPGDQFETAECDFDCTLPSCGDGVTNSAHGEKCDGLNDGEYPSGTEQDPIDKPHCTEDCTGFGPYCGDGVTQPDYYEKCDPGDPQNIEPCNPLCKPAVCGDGFTLPGVEECDDGNALSGDGCTFECKASTEEYVIFVTSGTFKANFGSVAEADATCQEAAEKGGLINSASYKAWISAVGNPAKDDVKGDAEYIRRDGAVVAIGSDLSKVGMNGMNGSVTLKNPVSISENGDKISGLVWTGTTETGEWYTGADCNGWTSLMPNDLAGFGDASQVDVAWTRALNLNTDGQCDKQLRLYCFRAQ